MIPPRRSRSRRRSSLNSDPAVVEAATKRMIAGRVYPDSVDIAPEALKTGLNTQIFLGNLKEQPDYKTFVARSYIEKALSSQ